MRVVHVSSTPVAGVPAITAALMTRYLPGVEARAVQGRYKYGDGRVFPHDLTFKDKEAGAVLKRADVVVIHNRVKELPASQLQRKTVILVCHSQPGHVDSQWLKKADAVGVVAQYQPRLFRKKRNDGVALVPNLIPVEDDLYLPVKRGDTVTFTHSPSRIIAVGKDDERFWDDKGTRWIEKMVDRRNWRDRYHRYMNIPLTNLLKQRRKHHILIDEMRERRTGLGSYHRNALEGASQGQFVLTSADKRTLEYMKMVAGTRTVPFSAVWVEELPVILEEAVKTPAYPVTMGERAREWMREYWHPRLMCERHWLPLMEGRATVSCS